MPLKYSIIIPTYNRPQSCQRLLNSIERANPKDIEIIVVDDCSTRTYTLSTTFPLTYIRNPKNTGGGFSRNLGAKKAKGDYLLYLDDDMTIESHFFQTLNQILKNKNIDILGGAILSLGKNTSSLYFSIMLSLIYKFNFLPAPVLILKKEVMKKYSFSEKSYAQASIDYDFFTRLPTTTLYYCKKPLARHEKVTFMQLLKKFSLYAHTHKNIKHSLGKHLFTLAHKTKTVYSEYSLKKHYKSLSPLKKIILLLLFFVNIATFLIINKRISSFFSESRLFYQKINQ